MVKVNIQKSTRDDKRLMATFTSPDNKKSITHFGYSSGNKTASTYLEHGDDKKKLAWLKRHSVRGTFNDYKSPSALARWILWNRKTFDESLKDYKNRFNLK